MEKVASVHYDSGTGSSYGHTRTTKKFTSARDR